jgi:hypothetical protein
MIPQASASIVEAAVYMDSDVSSAKESVVDALLRCLANIQRLTLHVVDLPIVPMLTSSNGFKYLMTLFLRVNLQRGDKSSCLNRALESFPTSVERVSYRINGPTLKPLIPLQCHYIKYLEIRCLSLSDIALYSQRWTAMCTIMLDHNTTIN